MDKFNTYLADVGEYAVVQEVRYPLVTADGFPHAKIHEVVLFESGEQGEIFSIEKDHVKILLLSRNSVTVGSKVVRTDTFLRVPVGSGLLSAIVDPLGNSISATSRYSRPKEERDVEAHAVSLSQRARVKNQLFTGVALIDLLIPFGSGQRELVLGDRKTGKSSFLFTSVKNNILQGGIVVYAAIGKKQSDIKKMRETFEREGLAKNMIFVATSSDDSPSLISLTPSSAMTMAEYFRDLGQNVLLVLDDLSTHAKFYREIGLLSGGFPGRESYPGDIFYTHANLLERAGNFKVAKGEASITCLPVVETVDGDLSSYIATNVMSMTDGHVFFDFNAFAKGRRPAINIQLSVTRVGRQTQSPLAREINQELTKFLGEYERVLNFSHFGAELSTKVKGTLKKGNVFYRFFNQHLSQIVPYPVQVVLFGLIWSGAFNDEKDALIDIVRKKYIDLYATKQGKMAFDALTNVKSLYALLSNITRERENLKKLWR